MNGNDSDGTEQAEAATNLTSDELDNLKEAFVNGRFVNIISEHEGATQTVLFEVPHGHIGLSVCISPPEGDVFVSVDEWEKEPHHEVGGRWIWVRSHDTDTEQ